MQPLKTGNSVHVCSGSLSPRRDAGCRDDSRHGG